MKKKNFNRYKGLIKYYNYVFDKANPKKAFILKKILKIILKLSFILMGNRFQIIILCIH